MNTALALLLFAKQFAKVVAGGAVTAPIYLRLHPPLKRAWQRNPEIGLHDDEYSKRPSASQS
jgi:hypothetical protein